jgi:diguanylate cyclase (GGDEF)-like protein/PAS domain S-box-containing protein
LNEAAEKITGWSKVDAQGLLLHLVFKIINASNREPETNLVELVLKNNHSIGLPINTILVRKDGIEIHIEDSSSPINNSFGKQYGVVIVFRDVSAAQDVAAKFMHLAQHDTLTNLPNRVVLNDRIGHAIALGGRNKNQFYLLFIDLDNFKNINDSLGHAVGDLLLQEVAHRLVSCIRQSDTVSRQGGDEFVVLLSDCHQKEEASHITAKILSTVLMPFRLKEANLSISASIGISIYPQDGADVASLINHADAAMYQAKKLGRNNYQFYQAEFENLAQIK